ncbi:hypothetical protein [Aquisphaera insulae]|uniref:hypothetical protein n=1 Tax=Aquisphaera insulae TaxID=2712864 RepID=UPI0013EBF398|nr:hypothetical protein [Aquisphaera insulae]
MSRRARIVLACLVALAVGLEVAVRSFRGAPGKILIRNDGSTPVEGLIVRFGTTEAAVGRLEAGGSERVRLDGDAPGTINLKFTQRGNPLNGFQIEGFDPREVATRGTRMVIEIRPGEVARYMDDDDPSPAGQLRDRVLTWLGIGGEPDVTN